MCPTHPAPAVAWAAVMSGQQPGPGTRRSTANHGSVAVETALLLPVLLTVLLGIVEVGMLIQSQVGAAAAARAAVRAGSAASVSADDPLVVAKAALSGGLGVTAEEVDEIWVYRPRGLNPDDSVQAPTVECAQDCVRITIDPFGAPQWAGGNWSEPSPIVCSGSDGYLGVRIFMTRRSLSVGFGLPDKVSSHAVMRYEPRLERGC